MRMQKAPREATTPSFGTLLGDFGLALRKPRLAELEGSCGRGVVPTGSTSTISLADKLAFLSEFYVEARRPTVAMNLTLQAPEQIWSGGESIWNRDRMPESITSAADLCHIIKNAGFANADSSSKFGEIVRACESMGPNDINIDEVSEALTSSVMEAFLDAVMQRLFAADVYHLTVSLVKVLTSTPVGRRNFEDSLHPFSQEEFKAERGNPLFNDSNFTGKKQKRLQKLFAHLLLATNFQDRDIIWDFMKRIIYPVLRDSSTISGQQHRPSAAALVTELRKLAEQSFGREAVKSRWG